jgi:hypothetical protein
MHVTFGIIERVLTKFAEKHQISKIKDQKHKLKIKDRLNGKARFEL